MAHEEEVTDEALMLDLANGNEQAFPQLFNRWKAPLISYFYRSLNDYHRSEDMTLMVASRVYAARNSYKVVSKFSTWLFRIAQNLLRDEYRKTSKKKEEVFHPELHYEIPVQTNAHSLSDMEEWLAHAISELSPQERSLVLLVYQQDFTPSEAAEVLSIKPNHARVLLHKARTYLSEKFRNHEQG